MNDLERLKRAEESEPMAVAVFPMPVNCLDCPCMDKEYGYCEVMDKPCSTQNRADCPLLKAIGIIEPNGHVVYLREGD